MPWKNQCQCYRTINGQRYRNACDVMSEAAEKLVALVKAKKIPHRLVKAAGSYKQLFVLESRFSEVTQ